MAFFNAMRVASPIQIFRGDGKIETKGWEELRAGITTVASQGSGNLVPTVQTVQAIKKYRSWIYPAVNLISRKCAEVPYYLYEPTGHHNNREEFKKILDHPAIHLLKHPNKFLSGRQLKEIIFLYLELCGFACVKILRRTSGQPYELHVMYPHELVEIQLGTDTDHIIRAFHFAPLNNRQKREIIPYEDMLYFHYPHPENPYLPYTPLQASAHATDLDLYLQTYEKDFFHNSARPDFVIIPDRQIQETTARRIQEGWMARHRGPGKRFKPAVLSETMKIQQLSMSARDFEFLAMANWTKEHILSTYNVSEEMLGLTNNSNKATSITTQTIFYDNCLKKRLHIFEDVINAQLLTLYRNVEGYEFEHTNAKPKDDEWDLARNTGELSAGLVTINEIRKREGLQPFKSKLCDVPWVNGQPIPGNDEEADRLWKESQAPPPNLMSGLPPGAGGEVPQLTSNAPEAQGEMGQLGGRPEGSQLSSMVAEAMRQGRPNLSAMLNMARGKRGGLATLIQNNPSMGSLGALLDRDRADTSLMKLLSKEIHDQIEGTLDEKDKLVFKTYEEMAGKLEGIFEDFVEESKNFYVKKGAQLSEIVTKMFSDFVMKGADGVDDIEEEELREDYKHQVAPFAIKAVEIAYATGFKLVQKAGSDVRNADTFEEASMRAAGKYLDKSADLKVKATKKALKEIIQEALVKGLSSTETAELIQDRFEWIGGNRAERIARTEISAAVWAGHDASYEQINKEAGKIIVKRATFWTALDERVCKECTSHEGKPIKDYSIGKQYISMPPHVNCRCIGKPELVGE